MKDISSIYYMRLFAVILIVNSHFNPKHIVNFKHFALYGYLGNLGNMIFFFISSYVLTIGFKKYENQHFRWVLYRLSYLLIIILSVRTGLKLATGEIPNIIEMFFKLFINIDFFSVMIYLSALFPLMFSISKNYRTIILFTLFIGILFVNDSKLSSVIVYTFIFLLGISIAKKEIAFTFTEGWKFFILFLFSAFLFGLAKLKLDYLAITNPIKVLLIIFLFHFLQALDLSKLFPRIKRPVKEVAKLSLYIYLTHFYFINFSYQLNRYLGLLIIFILIIPICYVENIILDPVVRYSKKLFIKS